MRKQLISFAQVIKVLKTSNQTGVNPPPCVRPCLIAQA